MLRDYYYLKEILLGLRPKYLISETKLKMLKDCISYSKLKYKDIYFSVNSEDGIRNTVVCNLKKRNFNLLNVDQSISTRINNVDGMFRFDELDKEIQVIDSKKFNELYQEILNDEFLNKTRFSSFIEKDVEGNKICINILFDPSGIYISPHFSPVITYLSNKDLIRIDAKNNEKFEITLDTKISKDSLPSLYCNILYDSDIQFIDIDIIGDIKPNKTTDYDIDKINNKILLMKRY